ncbi:Serpentine receptor class T-55 [Toxocara canis]|uniref:Serpentine receptor class T-55 n=1 Tax=Toxocara canis TaxID=6265 RepID=A0A0B2VFZ8_TOXCA|nr:Serpentine receptor class T-55 [Toxocara canis]
MDTSNFEYIVSQCQTLNANLNKPNVSLGIAYMIIGLIYVVLYIPCMVGILNPVNFKLSCYKIMAVMGAIDIATLSIGVMSGYFSIVGVSVCTCPTLMLISGHCVMGFWTTYCGVCIYLGINRCADVYKSRFMEVIFKGYRIWLFILIPITFGLCVLLFGPAMYYSSSLGVWFFDIDPNSEREGNVLHLLVNTVCVAVILLQYVAISARLYMMTRSQSKLKKMSPAARSVLMQTFLISIPLLIASSMYIIIQFVSMPPVFTIISELTWQSCHGDMAIIYLVFNSSMRIKFLQTLHCIKGTRENIALHCIDYLSNKWTESPRDRHGCDVKQ